jgi:hypothetical protein
VAIQLNKPVKFARAQPRAPAFIVNIVAKDFMLLTAPALFRIPQPVFELPDSSLSSAEFGAAALKVL